MDITLENLQLDKNPKVEVRIMQGHFARSHSHVNVYIDISQLKTSCTHAREATGILAEPYLSSVDVDAIVCLDGMEVVGSFLAQVLTQPGQIVKNSGRDIAIVAPEQNRLGQMMFRDNTKKMIEGKRILLLAGSINTGKTILQAKDTVLYYGGKVCGICSVFSTVSKIAGMEVHALFTKREIPEYQVYETNNCPMCKAGRKVDAIVNSFGYSEL